MNTTQTDISEYLLKLKAALEEGKRDPKHDLEKKQQTVKTQDRQAKSAVVKVKSVLSTSTRQTSAAIDADVSAAAPKKDVNQKRIPFHKNERILAAHAYLHEKFPNVFKREEKLPLKIGILNDIFECLDADTPSKKSIRDAVQFYTSNYHYQKALLANDKRYDLNGIEVGVVEEKQKEHATDRHDKISAIIKEKQEKRQALYERKRMIADKWKAERLAKSDLKQTSDETVPDAHDQKVDNA